ncbi:MAG: hypothetical protein AAGA38_15590 [Pseudomonadota bacterium]
MRDIPPLLVDERARVEMTTSCRDCDVIPKVTGAGKVVQIDNEHVQLMHNGLKVKAGGYYGDWMIEIIERLGGHHEPQEELVFHTLMDFFPKNGRMIELGAFWSYYSIWFMLGHPERRALGIEPDPAHIEIGKKNAALNGVQLEIRQGFLGSEGPATAPFQTEQSGILEIPRLAAADLCCEFAPEGLDLLHVDTQGAETGVIANCESLLMKGAIRFMLVSTHSETISGSPLTHQECLELIGDYGGRVLEEHDVHESFSGDGMIAAYFGHDPIDWPKLDLSYNRYSHSLFRNPIFDLAEVRRSLAEMEADSKPPLTGSQVKKTWLNRLMGT